jgi:hypothetical protein
MKVSKRFTREQVASEIAECEKALVGPPLRLWERVRIAPVLWTQQQYPGDSPFWVVAILGRRCLYYNQVEGGWGWGRFVDWWRIADYHCQQDEIAHTIHQTLFAIEEGGDG